MGNTMKQDRKTNSKALFTETVGYVLKMLEKNAHKQSEGITTITITVKGASEETEVFEIDNLSEVIKILKLN